MSRNRKNKKITIYNETLYEVEKILQIKWIKNKQYCYIKWKGYDKKYNTWEPKQHITFCYNYVNQQQEPEGIEEKSVQKIIQPQTPKHQYETRLKVKPQIYKRKSQKQEKQDYTQLQSHSQVYQQNIQLYVTPQKKQKNKYIKKIDLSSIKKIQEKQEKTQQIKQNIVFKIIQVEVDNIRKTKIAKVQYTNNKIGYMYQDVLKTQYPQKLVDYYEAELKKTLGKTQ